MIIQKSDRFLYEGKVWTYAASLTETSVQLYCEADHLFVEADLSDIELISLASQSNEQPSKDLAGASWEEWELAEYRYLAIKEYLHNIEQNEAFEKLQAALSLSESRAYVLLRNYNDEVGPSSLLRSKKGRKTGSKFIAYNIESIISSAIDHEWEGPGSTIKKVFLRAEEMCRAAGAPPPSYGTVKKRLKERPESNLAKLSIGVKRANDKYSARPKHNNSQRPLAKWQMDHCVIDCIIVDEKTRRPLCRPWATLIIDLHNRVVPGYYLSLNAPGAYNVAMAITHAVCPKGKWIEVLGDEDIKYPYYGRPEEIAMDNAKEFKSQFFRIAAKKNNIHLAWRPIGKPWWGGHIERLNGTLAMSYIHFLPGTTLSNVVLRGDYDSEGKACLTFSEFRLWFARAIQSYHHSEHRMLDGMTPHEKWIEGWTAENGKLSHPALLANPQEFFIDFLPEESRVITRQGIMLWNINYWSPSLASCISGKKCSIKYNPNSLRHIWVNPTGERYIQVPYSDITRPDISIEEYRAAKREVRRDRRGAAKVTSDEVFLMIQKNRALVENSKKLTKQATRKIEHRENATGFDRASGVIEMPVATVNIDDDEYDSPPKIFPVDA